MNQTRLFVIVFIFFQSALLHADAGVYILLNNQVYSDRETENVPTPIFNTTGYPPSFALSLVGDKLYFGSLQETQVIIETDKDLSPANNSHLVVSTINDLY
ncbi:MAG: hypothetical protein KDD62_07495, partial [Bdellovibrionales bacterium]|nr:hypothetical protein [Bdellovibrionales bacterium]